MFIKKEKRLNPRVPDILDFFVRYRRTYVLKNKSVLLGSYRIYGNVP